MAAATGLVALHVADDSFFQPASGTSALDHLPGGLIPIAVLALGAWAYPSVRAGPVGHRSSRPGCSASSSACWKPGTTP